MKSKSKTILVDADAIIAISVLTDSNHTKARKLNKSLKEQGYSYIFSMHTVAEITTVISNKVSQEEAKRVLEKLRQSRIFEFMVPSDLGLIDKWFNKQKKKGTSYFDCYNMAIMEFLEDNLAGIFSFDKVYKENGFTLAKDLVKL